MKWVLAVHAKLGFGGSDPGAEPGLGVPGGQTAPFPLDNHPAWEQPSGEWRRNGLRKSKKGAGAEATLNNQERGKEWEYRVIAVNKAGEGGLYREETRTSDLMRASLIIAGRT